jgi:radical SAM superfamily enzyme YgiQ (UPF0313 family)
MKVLLCHCDFAPASLALLNLKSYAMAQPELRGALDIRFVGSSPHEDPETTIGAILHAAQEFRPDVIGFSLYIWSRHRMYEASMRVRIACPDAFIIWGGPDVSDPEYAEELLGRFSAPDLIVRDEGERTFAAVLSSRLHKDRALDDITGITWRTGEAVKSNAKVTFLENLDDIPSALDLPEVQALLKETSVFAMETFRGCYMGCAYCYWGGTTRRSYSMERTLKDLKRILEHRNIKKLWFFDSMFGFKKSTAKELLRFILEHKDPSQCVTFFPNLDFLDDELCRLMKEAGVYIEAGIQTTNDEAYEYINRKWDRRFLDSKIPLLQKHGLHANNQQLILGLPGDDIEGFRKSVDYAVMTRPESIMVFPFSVLPATGYWKRRKEFGIKYEGEFRIVYESNTFSEADMVRGGLISVGVKWFECAPGLALRVVDMLGLRPSELFERMGEVFAELAWGLSSNGGDLYKLRRRLLTQAFAAEDRRHLTPDLLLTTMRRHFAHLGHDNVLAELVAHHAMLNCDEVLIASNLDAPSLQALDTERSQAVEHVPIKAIGYNIFHEDAKAIPDTGPVHFAAWSIAAPRDFFGKDITRWKVLVFDPADERIPQAMR